MLRFSRRLSIDSSTPHPNQSQLTPAELAEAAFLADLALVVVIVTRLTPLATLTQVIGCVPFAVLAMRHRFKVVWVGFWVAFVLTFLLAGYGEALRVIIMVVWGTIAGRAIRNHWGWARSFLWSLTVGWVTTSAITLFFFFLLSRFRELWLEATQNQWDGLSALLSPFLPEGWLAWGDAAVAWSIQRWWVIVPAGEFLFGIWMTIIVRRMSEPIGHRVQQTFGPVSADDDASYQHLCGNDLTHQEPQPVPIHLIDVTIGREQRTLFHIDNLQLDPGSFVVITGANGTGKSTLLKGLAGTREIAGLRRPGAVGLGRCGGTALIGQRPESQVLGARVMDDLRWGATGCPGAPSAAEVLRMTGLTGFEQRETARLSGGELQRLAIAGALLRQPRLLLSDESTSMLSPQGRDSVIELFQTIASTGCTVVHVSHLESDIKAADKVFSIDNGVLVTR